MSLRVLALRSSAYTNDLKKRASVNYHNGTTTVLLWPWLPRYSQEGKKANERLPWGIGTLMNLYQTFMKAATPLKVVYSTWQSASSYVSLHLWQQRSKFDAWSLSLLAITDLQFNKGHKTPVMPARCSKSRVHALCYQLDQSSLFAIAV